MATRRRARLEEENLERAINESLKNTQTLTITPSPEPTTTLPPSPEPTPTPPNNQEPNEIESENEETNTIDKRKKKEPAYKRGPYKKNPVKKGEIKEIIKHECRPSRTNPLKFNVTWIGSQDTDWIDYFDALDWAPELLTGYVKTQSKGHQKRWKAMLRCQPNMMDLLNEE